MEQAGILRLVVASPGDVQIERKVVERAVAEVNSSVAKLLGLRIEVSKWEKDAYPGFHKDGPQGLIDYVLRIEQCDIFVAIFWKRFGTPVSDAKSGTEHEFKKAYAAWQENRRPHIMVYFCEKAYAPKSKQETDQWGLMLKFKEEFPRDGLWWAYQNPNHFEALLRNHLTQFLSNYSPTAQLATLHQLPPPPADFTGRDEELAELRAAILRGGATISGLHGQGGVGKTALALKLAEGLEQQFPDAQIHLDLKGVSEKPLTAAEAMAHVIRSFHPEAKLPEKLEDLQPLYQNVLHGKRALLLMDNARDAAQVGPLIPPHGCALLVTSRWLFTLPGLHARNLDIFPPGDAKKLLLEIAPRICSEAERIAKLCGYLPQALRLAASALDVRRDMDPADYARKLEDEKQRLKLLTGSEDSVEASISFSYNLLDPATQKRWRMLGVFPDTFDAPAAAAVWGIEDGIRAATVRERVRETEADRERTPAADAAPGMEGNTADDQAKETLSPLVQYSMLEWNEATKRYRLHDLMRDFARTRTEAGENQEAALRHAGHYEDLLARADDFYLEGGQSLLHGLALFDLEWGNIQAGQTWAARHSAADPEAASLCSAYSGLGAYCLNLRQHSREQIRWLEAALAAARSTKDRPAEGAHLGNLGLAYARLGETRRAIEFHEQRLAIAREIGDRRGEGNALGNLGNAYLVLGETRRAIEFYEQHLAIAHEIGDRRGEGIALGNLGNAYLVLGETRRAIEFFEQALAIDREIGDRRSEGNALWNMSLALDKLGDRKQAIERAEAALMIYEQIEDPYAAKVRRRLEEWKKSEPRP